MAVTPDIVSIINSYAPLEQKGRVYKGFCPFCHSLDDKLIVRPEVNEWHCFQCGAGGNASDFVSLYEGVVMHPTADGVEEAIAQSSDDEATAEVEVEAEPAPQESADDNEQGEADPFAGCDDIFKGYFARLRKVTGYKATAILDGNKQLVGLDNVSGAETDFEQLNDIFTTIFDNTHAVFGESFSTLESEVLLTGEEGVALYLSLHYRDEPVHVIILGSEKGQQYLMRMHAGALSKL